MNRIIRLLDANLCFYFCLAKGFVALIDQIELEEAEHLMTAEHKARSGWTDYQ